MMTWMVSENCGMSFGAYLKEHIFEPLVMENTAFQLSECRSQSLATQYSLLKNGDLECKGKANCLIPPILKESASGGLIDSVDDSMKFQEALCRKNVLLSKSTTNPMRPSWTATGSGI